MDYSIPYVAQSYYIMALNDMEVKDSASVLGDMDKERIKYFVESAYNDIGGATKRMQDTDIAHLRNISAKVFRESSLTGETRKTVSARLLNEATTMPGFRFVDKAGRKWDSKSYFDMLGRTVLMNASRASYMDACAAEGDDVVRVTVSGNPCPACASYENTLLSISGATPGLVTVDEAIADGLMHPNCTHSLVAVPPAMMVKYDENGRPNTGLNSPDNIQVDNAETQKEYRQEQIEANNEKFNTLFTSDDEKYNVSMASELANAPDDLQQAALTMPPVDKIKKSPYSAYNPGNDTIKVTDESSPVEMLHEYGHFVDSHLPDNVKDLRNIDFEAILKDYNKTLVQAELRTEIIDALNELKSSDEKGRLIDYFGAITKNQIGYGHSMDYLKSKGSQGFETFANMFSLYTRNGEEWKLLEKYTPELVVAFRQILSKITQK